jgi:hypothetical protein
VVGCGKYPQQCVCSTGRAWVVVVGPVICMSSNICVCHPIVRRLMYADWDGHRLGRMVVRYMCGICVVGENAEENTN